MLEFLTLIWRKKKGDRRYIVASIKREKDGISFEYLPSFKEAKKEGLEFFFGFKNEKDLTHQEISQLLSFRIISKKRPDRNEYLKFWEAESIENNFDLLGFTQGMTSTDNFEFLADYSTIKKEKLTFVTDLAGLSHAKLKTGFVKKGEILFYKKEINNTKDKYAVAVYNKEKQQIGYIKQIHNKIFHQSEKKFKLTVKAIDENGITKQIFVKVEK